MTDVRAPLTPAGCDLRDFPRLMIDIPRLFSSTFNAQASRNPLAWMIGHKLWYRSWHQVPAGSLPDDDDELCHLAELGFDIKSFAKAKAVAMRGWVKCSDGRLYHPVVCEAALEAWQEKIRQRLASGSGNKQRWGVDFDLVPVAADLRALIACMSALNPQSRAILKASKSLSKCDPDAIPVGRKPDPTGMDIASQRDMENPGMLSLETGTGTGTGNLIEEDANASFVSPIVEAIPTSRQRKRAYPAEFEAAWKAYPHHPGRSSKPNACDEWKRLPPDEQSDLVGCIERFTPNVATTCGGKGAPDMARWLKHGKHLTWALAEPETEEPALSPEDQWRQRLDAYQRNTYWNRDEWGPAPGKPGCRVPPYLLIQPAAALEVRA